MLLSVFVASVPVATAPAAAGPVPTCAVVGQLIAGASCVDTDFGVILSPDASEAKRLAVLATTGEARFRTHFGASPPRYAIAQSYGPAEMKALRAAGIPQVLPYLTPAQYEAGAMASVTRAVEAQTKAANLPAANVETIKAQAIAKWKQRNTPADRQKREAGIIPHELGHLWLIAQYWPATGVATGHYGGPGPDWLDETAAVLMEDSTMADQRRAHHARLVGGDQELAQSLGVDPASLSQIGQFLESDHPMSGVENTLRAQRTAGDRGVQVMTGDEARKASQGAIAYYLKARSFADYLIARSGNAAVFHIIAADLSRGRTFAQWLAADGRRNGLAPTMSALEKDYAAWIALKRAPST